MVMNVAAAKQYEFTTINHVMNFRIAEFSTYELSTQST